MSAPYHPRRHCYQQVRHHHHQEDEIVMYRPSRRINSIQRQLEQFLESRPDVKDLLARHILHNINVAPCLLQKSEQIMWKSRMRQLNKKIQIRPERQELLERGIVKEVTKAEIGHLIEGLESKLSQRPDRVELVSKHILRNHNINPNIQTLQEMLLSPKGHEESTTPSCSERPNP